MLKRLFCLVSLFVIILGIKVFSQGMNSKRVFIHNIDNQEFNVVVIKKNDKTEARKLGIKSAAAETIARGYRYFIIRSEEEVSFMEGKKNWPSAYDFPQNLYEEEIVERGYNRERFYNKSTPSTKPQKALRFRVKCMSRPTQRTYDAHKYK